MNRKGMECDILMKLVKKLVGPPLKAQVTLTLPWEQRIKSRQRVRLDNGREAGLFLPRGGVLNHGDILVSEDETLVQICAAEEKVSTVLCDHPLAMARACYHLGNRHTEIEIVPGRIRYLQDSVLDKMMHGLGLEVVIEQAPFEPEAGAYAQGHQHG